METKVVFIDKNKTYSELVTTYHINAAQKIIDMYYDSKINLGTDAQINELFYPYIIVNKLDVIVILQNNRVLTVYIPDEINESQLTKLMEINNYIKNENRKRSIKDKIITIPHFKRESYYSLDELLENFNNSLLRR